MSLLNDVMKLQPLPCTSGLSHVAPICDKYNFYLLPLYYNEFIWLPHGVLFAQQLAHKIFY